MRTLGMMIMWGLAMPIISCEENDETQTVIDDDTAEELYLMDKPEFVTHELDSVLGFEDVEAWRLSNGRTETVAGFGEGDSRALSVRSDVSFTLTSAPFNYPQTPNNISFLLRRTAGAAGPINIAAFVECREKGVTRGLVGNVTAIGTKVSEIVRIPMSNELQTKLAGGCSRAIVQFVLETPALGTFEFDDLRLRKNTPTVDVWTTPLCGLPDTDELTATAVETPGGYWDYQAWIGDPVPQAELPILEAVLAPMQELMLEPAFDHINRQVVIVADKEDSVIRKILSVLERAEIALPMRIQPACNPVREVRAVQREVLTRKWHRFAAVTPFSAYIDSSKGVYVVTFEGDVDEFPSEALEDELVEVGDDDRLGGVSTECSDSMRYRWMPNMFQPTVRPRLDSLGIVRDLEARFGSLVLTKWGTPGRNPRLDDGTPHYGAAGIGYLNNNFCTAGFVVNRSGTLGAVSAGHCFNNSDAIYSGPRSYGTATGKATFPTYDMIRISPSGSFSKVIHTDPCCPMTRTQVGKSNPSVGNMVCISGMISRAKCGVQVVSLSASLCDSNGCTNSLRRGTRAGVNIAQEGDSGAPIYTRSGDTGAIINGMHVGTNNCCGETLFHHVTLIESQLGVTVAQ